MTLTLEQALSRKNNNFDLIRLLAAIAVIFGHSFYLFPSNGYTEPVKKILLIEYSGSLAVYIFFFLSGIFISSSFNNSKTFARFLLMRIFRIWPALITCVVITVFIVGPVFTALSLHDYFASPQTLKYLFTNTLMLKFDPVLPGVFNNDLNKNIVNGSLWTLPTEIKCYALVAILGLLGLLKRGIFIVLVLIVLLVFRKNLYLIEVLTGPDYIKQVLLFVLGMLAYHYRSWLYLNSNIAWILVASCIASYVLNLNFKLFIGLFYVTFMYTTLVFASSDLAKKIKLPGDYSYGIYIYGFLVQQIIAYTFPRFSAYPSMLVTIPIACALGAFSWYCIELPAINIGKRIAQKYTGG